MAEIGNINDDFDIFINRRFGDKLLGRDRGLKYDLDSDKTEKDSNELIFLVEGVVFERKIKDQGLE